METGNKSDGRRDTQSAPSSAVTGGRCLHARGGVCDSVECARHGHVPDVGASPLDGLSRMTVQARGPDRRRGPQVNDPRVDELAEQHAHASPLPMAGSVVTRTLEEEEAHAKAMQRLGEQAMLLSLAEDLLALAVEHDKALQRTERFDCVTALASTLARDEFYRLAALLKGRAR